MNLRNFGRSGYLAFSYHADCRGERELCGCRRSATEKVVEYFASFDEHIKDPTRQKRFRSDGESKEEKYKINALHKKIDSDEMAEIPLGAESAGT